MKNIILVLITIYILTLFVPAAAAEISEIEIKGLQKSDTSLIEKQLAFSVREKFEEEKLILSRQRLLNSDLFNPFTLKLAGREITQDKLKVIVEAEESGVFMIHPYEFAIRKTTGLLGEKFEQKIWNPAGNGISYNLAFDWSDDSYQEYGLEYLADQGKIYRLSWRNFDQDLEFNQQQYLTEGNFYKFEIESLPVVNIKNTYSLKYQKNDYSTLNKDLEQEYLIPDYNFLYRGAVNFEAGLSRAFSLDDDQSDFNKITININKGFELNNKSQIIADFKGGYASDETPFNYQFTAGAFSKSDGGIPIRGQEYEFAGTKYLKGTLEYQRQLWQRKIWGVLFIDTAKISASNMSLSDYDCETDAGVGIIYYSFSGPIRADLGFDNLDSDPIFNIGFGSSF
ncbi:hypothetical protein [Halanaerobium sp.]|uniref:hypothetical protein n=1 Tax=Halanaerobium sp. TaxID=1895664 RepID=UPI0025C20E69|nr:hypothetical protein [Halanaerobium sp.]